MLIRRPADIPSSEITPREVYLDRRAFMGTLGAFGVAAAAGAWPRMACAADGDDWKERVTEPDPGPFSTDEPKTSYRDVTNYVNFYEFGPSKSDPPRLARAFRTEPWTVEIDGEVMKPATLSIEDLLRPHDFEERIYRLRCVEAWSMVIPWVGFPLGDLLKRFEPTSRAKYVRFETLYDPSQMPGQRLGILDWPYVEGLRIDEAMHPLTLMVVGLYGEVLPNQNGAPLRLVVPWKYGFKSIKSIVRITLTETQPRNSWSISAPHEYGFYANVNPHVDHPRWSQASERRVGHVFRRETLMFNGYGEHVAHLYEGMDLHAHF